ncbi:MAG: S8 family serine peptidase [Candidatus Thorarchaeota archaeon]|nr:S8 family serine peptidase [Candidatus Thorarchaeota archaeon]
MHGRLLLTLILLTLILPLSSMTVWPAESTSQTTASLCVIDPRLEMSLSEFDESSRKPTSAILQFAAELSPAQIARAERNGICFVRRAGEVVHVGRVYSVRLMDKSALDTAGSLGLVHASSGDKQFFPSLLSSVPATEAPTVWSSLKVSGVPLRGTGSRVAVIDTGAAWLHPAFWRVTTEAVDVIQSGGRFYADLNGNAVTDTGEGPIRHIDVSDYGVINTLNEYLFIDTGDDGQFDYAEGDRWLAGVDSDSNGIITLPGEDVVVLGEPKIAALYDQMTSSVYLRGTNLTSLALSVGDTKGHGTHVASTVAGGQIGYTSMLGMAPDADLIIIRSSLTSAEILDAISFAVSQGADVINMSFSSFIGFLDGTDIEDIAINEAFRTWGVLSTLAAGNLGGTSKHARFSVPQESEESAVLSVSSPPSGSFLNILWNSEDSDEAIRLVSPSDEIVDLGSFASHHGVAFEVNTDDLKAYVFPSTSVRGTNRLVVQVVTGSHLWKSGSWDVVVSNPSGKPVVVDMYAWDTYWSGTNMRFSTKVDNEHTVSSPATADLGIAVGSCDDGGSSISSSSGRGPRIDGVFKPTVAAPGQGITAANTSLSKLWQSLSGTSMASPHVAGLLALLGQALNGSPGWRGLSALFQGAGRNGVHYSPPVSDWGYGAINALGSARLLVPLATHGGISDWAGVDTVHQDPLDPSLPSSLDIRAIRFYPTVSSLSVAVSLTDIADFSGTNELRIDWDTDSNSTTGQSGVDLRLTLTGGVMEVLRWSGSAFEPAPLGSGFWNSSTSVFVWVEKTADMFGNLSVSTRAPGYSPADTTPVLEVEDVWRPLIGVVTVTPLTEAIFVSAEVVDTDSSSQSLSIGWSVVDGAMAVLESGMTTGSRNSSFSVTRRVSTHGQRSVLFNVTDGDDYLYIPPVFLLATSTAVRITDASLDSDTIVVGPFVSTSITGRVVVEGYEWVSSVTVAIRSNNSYWLNFTLTGTEGVYPFKISSAGFAEGQYTVFAVVVTAEGESIVEAFGILTVVRDNTVLFLIGLGVVGVIVIFSVRTRLASKTTSEAIK